MDDFDPVTGEYNAGMMSYKKKGGGAVIPKRIHDKLNLGLQSRLQKMYEELLINYPPDLRRKREKGKFSKLWPTNENKYTQWGGKTM